MKIIAHRANINGSNSSNENRLSQIRKCIELGYDVEIDIRVIKNSLFLGHDCPEEKITEKEILYNLSQIFFKITDPNKDKIQDIKNRISDLRESIKSCSQIEEVIKKELQNWSSFNINH